MSLKPNDLGLFGMLGNAHEWCHDRYYGSRPPMPKVEEIIVNDDDRVLRGGAVFSRPQGARSAKRGYNRPDNRSHNDGFRPARTYP
jgi:formylglycine-generating enzyme required for sulfatase activity